MQKDYEFKEFILLKIKSLRNLPISKRFIEGFPLTLMMSKVSCLNTCTVFNALNVQLNLRNHYGIFSTKMW